MGVFAWLLVSPGCDGGWSPGGGEETTREEIGSRGSIAACRKKAKPLPGFASLRRALGGRLNASGFLEVAKNICKFKLLLFFLLLSGHFCAGKQFWKALSQTSWLLRSSCCAAWNAFFFFGIVSCLEVLEVEIKQLETRNLFFFSGCKGCGLAWGQKLSLPDRHAERDLAEKKNHPDPISMICLFRQL